jgi:hypothetical protein
MCDEGMADDDDDLGRSTPMMLAGGRPVPAAAVQFDSRRLQEQQRCRDADARAVATESGHLRRPAL